jgi:formamidopyrimidine-DNA glycosylase
MIIQRFCHLGASVRHCPTTPMPELPEVEVTRLSLLAHLTGARIDHVRLGKPLRWPLGAPVSVLQGRRVQALTRRGKYLLLHLDDAAVLLLHLGMSGSLSMVSAGDVPGVHDHMDLHTDRGVLRLHDPRRFGAVVWAPSVDAPACTKLLAGLGVEPLQDGFHPQGFHAALRARRAPIKQVLMAGDVVVGVGNIYASEALFRAAIRPTARAHTLSLLRATRLHDAIRQVLRQAVELGGSTLRDFTDGHGASGLFQVHAMVYDRAGAPCRVCTTPIKRMVQGQRATYFCPQCQKR